MSNGGDCSKTADFRWTGKRTAVALALAQGRTVKQAAHQAGVSERTIYYWKGIPAFGAEVDSLSLLVSVATRAERLRVAMRAVRQSVSDAGVQTKRDVLDWLKFAQSETDGAQLEIARLAECYGWTAANVCGGLRDLR